MDPILVSAPPRAAYNPNRRISDLVLGQLRHFQHVEFKSGDLGIDRELARNIFTEGGAAQYIAAVTNALRKKGLESAPAKLEIVSRGKAAERQPSAEPLSIAAAASETTPTVARKSPATKTKPKPGSGNKRGKR